MPFIASLKSTGEEVNILRYLHPRNEFPKGSVQCPFCHEDVFIRGGLDKLIRAHFAHYANQCNATNIDWRSGQQHESTEHRELKWLIYQDLLLRMPEYFENPDIRIEHPIKFGEVFRIADVAVILQTGWTIAHEVQLSKIPLDELYQRTNDYEYAGIEVRWYLGRHARTDENIEWCLRRFGVCYTIDTLRSESTPYMLQAVSQN